jgi:hypothetical protein
MNKYHVTIVERVVHDCYVEAEDFHSAGMKAIESRDSWTEDLDAYSVETGEMCLVTPKADDSISWGELADLTHVTQVRRFGFCMCEDNEGNEKPYEDCPEPRVRVLREVVL